MKKITRTLFIMILFTSTFLFATGVDSSIITKDKISDKIVNTSGATDIVYLSAYDKDDKTADISFIIKSLPDANLGILYMANGTKVTVGQKLTQEKANGLKFDPKKSCTSADAKFTYVGVNDATGREGEKFATVTIPLTVGTECTAVTTDDKVNPKMLNTLPAVDILNLSGKDADGKAVDKFIIKSLPSAESGKLYKADGKTAVVVGEHLTKEEADGLKFDPKAGYIGDAKFTYQAEDAKGNLGNVATVTLPIIKSGNVTTDDKINPKMPNTLPAVDILNLSGKDANGVAVDKFVIKSLPSAESGKLYKADGKTAVVVGEHLTKDEADGLKFDPKAGYVGDAKFTYQAEDANGNLGNVATVTLPIGNELGVVAPVTDDKENPALLNSLGAVNITDLSGTDANGDSVNNFIIKSLPSAESGVLYMADGKTAVVKGETLTKKEADGLKFDPKAGYVGDAKFTYQAKDAKGKLGNIATVTIPVVKEIGGDVLPVTDNKENPDILNSLGAVDITTLSGTDSKGDAVGKFIIKSLPSPKSGVLYMADGKTAVVVGQHLTKEEAEGLKFDPKDGYVGKAKFTYQAEDSNGKLGNVATVTLPVVSGTNVTTDDKVNPNMLNSLPAVDILNLSGKDADGKAVDKFIIKSLPSAESGVLYMADGTTAVVVGQHLTKEEADGLKFDPKAGYVGDVKFTYQAEDSKGNLGNVATVTIPVVKDIGGGVAVPVADNKKNPAILNSLGAVDITDLSGTDSKGKAVDKFVIKSLPSPESGVLYMADGKTAVVVGQHLTKEEADGLKFDPKEGYVGDAKFTYQAEDSNGKLSNVATVTIPVVKEIEGGVVLPIADNRVNPAIANNSGAVDITNLSGTDANGKAVDKFIIKSLPSPESGILYMADGKTAVVVGQHLTKEEAEGLKFDPKEGYVGDAKFTYQAEDSNGKLSNVATVTIPVVKEIEGGVVLPIADNRVNPAIANNSGAVDIINLSGTDANGTLIKRFVITSLPSADQGVLYMADGKTRVTLNQELTLEEANGLKFAPNSSFVGDATFTYAAIDSNGVKGNPATVTIPVEDCKCDDYTSSVPSLSSFGLLLMMILTSLIGGLLMRKELK